MTFTEKQLKTLNEYYNNERYLTPETKNELNKLLGLSEKRIAVWFKRKRYNDKKSGKTVNQVDLTLTKSTQKRKLETSSPEYEIISSFSSCSTQSPDYYPEPEEPEAKKPKYSPLSIKDQADEFIYGISRAKLLLRFGVL